MAGSATPTEPPLPETVTAGALDGSARAELRGLQKDLAELVARHLVAAGLVVDEDPQLALRHARYARRKASRIAAVREASGIAAYHAGEWAEALADLRAARRMGGGPGHLPVMADIERALGRPERALDLARGPEVRELGRDAQIELAIVAAGARRDLDELDAAVVALQIPELEAGRRDPWSPRLFYAYADNLLAAGRTSDAVQWFVHASDADEEGETDAARRLAELTGEPWEDDEDAIDFDVEDAAAPGADAPGEKVPDADAPGAEVPAAEVPAAEVSAAEVPAAVAPDTDAPDRDVPAVGGPAGSGPEVDAAAADAPDVDAPEADARADTAPADAVVADTAPEGTAVRAGEPAGRADSAGPAPDVDPVDAAPASAVPAAAGDAAVPDAAVPTPPCPTPPCPTPLPTSPDAAVPDTAVPDTAAPDTAAPGTAAADTAAADTAAGAAIEVVAAESASAPSGAAATGAGPSAAEVATDARDEPGTEAIGPRDTGVGDDSPSEPDPVAADGAERGR